MFNHAISNYIFLRMDCGLSNKLTFSIASGYFLNKSRIEIPEYNHSLDTLNTNGFSDIIVLPRYGVFNKIKGNKKTELTLGIGVKFPIGSHTDSTLQFQNNPITSKSGYAINQPIAQATMGSIDMMLYAFLFRSYKKQKVQIFTNFLHIKTGYNSIGQKFGDYSSLGVFVRKNLNKRIGITFQLRAERISSIKIINSQKTEYLNHDLFKPTIDPLSTGSFKTFFVPQITYNKNNLTFYTTSEIPIYQNVNGTQIGSKLQLTTGFNYRFQSKKSIYQIVEPLNK